MERRDEGRWCLGSWPCIVRVRVLLRCTAQANSIRGLLGEFGIVIAQGIRHIAECLPGILEDGEYGLPGPFRELIQRLGEHLKELDWQVGQLEREIQQWHRANEDSCRLAEIPGDGPITASALIASISDPKSFANGRQMAAWLGLVPRQHSSGGKSTLLGISKWGDCYLPTTCIRTA